MAEKSGEIPTISLAKLSDKVKTKLGEKVENAGKKSEKNTRRSGETPNRNDSSKRDGRDGRHGKEERNSRSSGDWKNKGDNSTGSSDWKSRGSDEHNNRSYNSRNSRDGGDRKSGGYNDQSRGGYKSGGYNHRDGSSNDRNRGRFQDRNGGRSNDRYNGGYNDRKSEGYDDRNGARSDNRKSGRFNDRNNERSNDRNSARFNDRNNERSNDRNSARFNDRNNERSNDRNSARFNDRNNERSNDRNSARFNDRNNERSNDRNSARFNDRNNEKSNDRNSASSHGRNKDRSSDWKNKDQNGREYKPSSIWKAKNEASANQPKEKEEGDQLPVALQELGGSKEDLDLINGYDDSETEQIMGPEGSANDGKLSTDLDDFMNSLGLDKTDRVVVEEDDEEQEMRTEPAESKRDKNRRERQERNEQEKVEKQRKKQAKEEAEKKQAEAAAASENVKNSLPSMDGFKIKKGTDKKPTGFASELLIEPTSEWYNTELSPAIEPRTKLTDRQVEELFERAKSLLKRDNDNYVHEDSRSNSQKQFMSQLLSAGTLSDKTSALTLLIQESPLHSMKYLDTMLGLCKKKSKGSAMQAVAALKDLCIGGVLPDRKLRWFNTQPLSLDTPSEWLVLWAFEDWLKHFFFSLIQQLEQLSHDSVVYIRSHTVLHILDLLKSKPEQEVNLLRLGVNKLGDSDRKVASRVSYLLLQIQQAHPAMKSVIIDSIAELMFRSGTDYHARYYSVITLNQTIFAHKDTEVANTLIRSYLQLFERLLAEWDQKRPMNKKDEPPVKIKKPRWKNKGNKGKHGGERQLAKTSEEVVEEQANKMMAAILTGLNRAYPFSKLPKDVFEKHMHTIYRGTHSSNFNTTIQALILLYQISKSEKNLSDRYFRSLYATLQDPKMVGSSKLRLYLNLVFKSLRDDSDHPERVLAFAKRILQITAHWTNIGAVTGVEFLLIELGKVSPILKKAMFDQGFSLPGDSSEEHKEYDGKSRDPLFAHAEKTKLWEIIPMLNHFHPTVAHYAEGLTGQVTDGELTKPDLELHTLAHFLDRFVYRNPKQNVTSRGGSIMQPLAAADPAASIISAGTGNGIQPINAYDWDKVDLSKISVEDKFFYLYFANRKDAPKPKKAKGGDEDDNVDEDEVWSAITKSLPDLEGADSDEDISDSDLSMADLDDDESDMEGLEDALSDDEDDIEGESEDDNELAAEISDKDENEVDDEDDLDLDDLDDNDLIGSDEEVPGEDEVPRSTKRAAEQSDKKSKRRKLKELPVFASADDYAQYLESDEE